MYQNKTTKTINIQETYRADSSGIIEDEQIKQLYLIG